MYILETECSKKLMPHINTRTTAREIEFRNIKEFRNRWHMCDFRDNGKSYREQCLEAFEELKVMNETLANKNLTSNPSDAYLNTTIFDKSRLSFIMKGKFNMSQIESMKRISNNFLLII